MAEDELPDLRVSLAFDKPAYDARDQIRVRLTIMNVGMATASSVHVSSSGTLRVYWERLQEGNSGVPLEPAERFEFDRDAALISTARGMVARLTVEARSTEPDSNPADNTVTIEAPVNFVYATFKGIVYGDGNGNAALDPGEALPDVDVELLDWQFGTFTQRTDDQGRFTFTDLPIGSYYGSYRRNDDYWRFPAGPVNVTVDGPDVLVRAAAPVSGTLTASMAFAKSSYQVGESAHLLVTLSNSGTTPIPGVTANGDANDATHSGWGPLAFNGTGVAVPPHSTVYADVTIPVTSAAFDSGWLTVAVQFGAPPGSNGTGEITARVRVPGGIAPMVVGRLLQERTAGIGIQGGPSGGDPLPGKKVYLRDRKTGQAVARWVTDAAGMFQFTNIPADIYDFVVVGPWQVVFPYPYDFVVRAGDDGKPSHDVYVRPGPPQPDPDPAPSSSPPQQPQQPQPVVEQRAGNGDTGELAETGANVIWLAIGGLLALCAGVGLVLRSRRMDGCG
ncbi:LPXTG cell wall anchor domain-containing protein [Actinocrispum sp. NPDC049592]|uniref:LPXTG cell wall anchor domain-containing protein n=1 Tax=Actinocrispum sp. NPDC049592 TaxID=3154835 RepID=UPI003438681F